MMDNIKDFDIAIIGAGSAGLTIASVAAQLNYKVVLIENHKMGGDCLNYGCIPSKAFLYASNKYKDFDQTFNHIKKSIEFIAPHDSIERFEKLGVTIINGFASFIDNENILVNGNNISAKKIVMATGSSAYIPHIKGLEKIDYLTNETVFSLTQAPKSIAILGAGPVGIEMAIAFNNLGIKTTVINKNTGILLNDDQELTELLKQKLLRDGIDFFEDTNLTRVSKSLNGIDLALESGGDEFILSASHFLIATGRSPNTKNLNLDNANVEYTQEGYIKTTKAMQTSNKNIYAIGDVTGVGLFTHIASYQASIFIKRVLFGSVFAKANYNALAWTTFSNPELSQVGLTESKAREIYGNKIKVFKADFKENDRAVTEDAKLGKAKLILNKHGKVLGISMLGKNSGELVQQWSQIIQNRQKPSKILKQIYTYPTYSDINRLLASKAYKELFLSKKTKFISKLLFKYIGNKI